MLKALSTTRTRQVDHLLMGGDSAARRSMPTRNQPSSRSTSATYSAMASLPRTLGAPS